MPKKLYVGVDHVARKGKKMYVGADNLARKVKKGYIGVGGVARPFFAGGELVYYGKASDLSVARRYLAATNVGNYALFGGGNTSISTTAFGPSNIVDAYNTSLVLSTPTTLSVARRELSATTVGTFALFCGGDVSTSSSSLTHSNVTDAYDETLTRSVPTALNTARSELVATTIGDYALIGGGYLSSKGVSAVVDAYTVA